MVDNLECMEKVYVEQQCIVEMCGSGNIENPKSLVHGIDTERDSFNSDSNESQSRDSVFCKRCELRFLDLTELNEHSKQHCIKKFSCVHCTSTFRRMDHLKRHVTSLHYKSKYYTCPNCGKDCRSHDMLLKHVKTHEADDLQVLKCRGCIYECKSLDELVVHESTHLLMDKHICSHCKKAFKRRDHMLRHVKSQHLNQQTVCPICSHSFKRKDHVVRHIREKHRMFISNGTLLNLPKEIEKEQTEDSETFQS